MYVRAGGALREKLSGGDGPRPDVRGELHSRRRALVQRVRDPRVRAARLILETAVDGTRLAVTC